MPFNASGKSGEYHYLVEFLLDSTTLHYAEEDLSIQMSNTSGQFYEGRLPQTGTLARGLGTFLEAKETVETFPVVLDNRDGAIEQHIENFEFANRNVNVWIGEGISKPNYSLVFPGFVAHPNGIRWDEDQASFTVVDRRLKDRTTLPPDFYKSEDFPDLQHNASGTSIPIVYGNYASSIPGGVGVPAVCTDMTQADKPFKIASHRIKSIDRVLRNGLTVPFQNVSLDQASFELPGLAFNSTIDKMTVNCQGLVDGSDNIIDFGHRVLENVYTSYMGVTGGDLNATAFNLLNLDMTERVRSVIQSNLSTETIVQELLNESSIDMRFVGGKYSPKFRSLDFDSDRENFFDVDIVVADESTEKAAFSVEKDPDRLYANKIRGRYNFDPVFGTYIGAFTKEITAATIAASAIVERAMDFNWFYDKSETESRIERELITFSTEPLTIDVTFTNRSMLQNLADQIDLTYNVFNDRTFQIRRMETDLGSMTTRIIGTDVFLLGVGRWLSPTAPTWAAATDYDKDTGGYWSNDSGYIDPGDPLSLDKALWF